MIGAAVEKRRGRTNDRVRVGGLCFFIFPATTDRDRIFIAKHNRESLVPKCSDNYTKIFLGSREPKEKVSE